MAVKSIDVCNIMIYGTMILNVICLLIRLSHPPLLKWVVVNTKCAVSLKKNTSHRAVLIMAVHCLFDSDVKQFTIDLCK